jgi:tRNA/tmRNA/rRNA uracil-C5-methylase (TrmA/RlmC/RlmD family)
MENASEAEAEEVKAMLHLTEYVEGLRKLEEDGCLNSPMCFGRIAGVLHTENDSLSDVVKSDRTELLYGVDYLIEEVMGLKFMISPFSFFQTNTKGCEVLYKKAREYVLSGAEQSREDGAAGSGEAGFADKVIFDLYSGTGTIAQMLAPIARKVVGVEIVEEAVLAARENAAINGLTNCEFIAGDVLKVLDELEEKPDFIVLDPPRDGIHPKAIEKIIAYGVENIVYISCKPTSLVRDLAIFQERGYKVEKACAIDQFPGTAHVECIVCIQRIK